MRHRKAGRKLNRSSTHRAALWNNMVTALLTHTRIETTYPKAMELRSFAEDTIGWGVEVHALVAKGEKMTPAEKAKVVHAKRMARRVVKTKDALDRLFSEIGPHFAKQSKGGYTRVIKTRVRKGDAAPMALIELVGLYDVAAA
jgi:large subunit ribosomal protein L17